MSEICSFRHVLSYLKYYHLLEDLQLVIRTDILPHDLASCRFGDSSVVCHLASHDKLVCAETLNLLVSWYFAPRPENRR